MEDENALYFIVRTGRASLQQTVDDWVEEYKVDKDSALLKLMQFFISASGCKGKVTSEMQASMEHTDIIRSRLSFLFYVYSFTSCRILILKNI